MRAFGPERAWEAGGQSAQVRPGAARRQKTLKPPLGNLRRSNKSEQGTIYIYRAGTYEEEFVRLYKRGRGGGDGKVGLKRGAARIRLESD